MHILIFLFVIIRVVDTFHKGFSIVYLVCQCCFQLLFYRSAFSYAGGHCRQIVFFVHHAPVDTFLEMFLQHEIEPYTCASAVALTEKMCHIHFNIFVGYLLKRFFGHQFYLSERSWQIGSHSKQKSTLGYIHRADMSSEVVQTAK